LERKRRGKDTMERIRGSEEGKSGEGKGDGEFKDGIAYLFLIGNKWLYFPFTD
jgi:hypothetical protein